MNLDTEHGPLEKARKRQRVESKPAKKAPKKSWSMTQPHTSSTAAADHSNISPKKTAEDEHISAIVKECLKYFAPLLFNKAACSA
ncbi:hypothetical protein NDU88_005948 [Pleurodeles waltl]|uniref:Uncharacterized protein n=1 Tax=Pleurodeles waltl TaxID=8319 RepID=A0AAV7UNK0_PLEWA|nr:hypothetical protein NDU88_005948 [Pleurodeles waltl]